MTPAMNSATASLLLLRFCLGWYMFFAGIEKVLNPAWSASNFLLGAKTFPAFYAWFATPTNSVWVDPLNAWGITLVGVALLLGVAIRLGAFAGVGLMLLYYFPHVEFPFVPHGFIVEEHIIYAAAFLVVAFAPQAHAWSLANVLRRTFVGRLPLLRALM